MLFLPDLMRFAALGSPIDLYDFFEPNIACFQEVNIKLRWNKNIISLQNIYLRIPRAVITFHFDFHYENEWLM